jgi:uncharacterized membrane protein YagU involved in acid resistance
MDVIGRGIIAGFLATLALSAVFDPIATLARMADVLPPTFAWVLHFTVGSLIWGAGFAVAHDHMRGPSWARGLLFGIGAWLVVMLTVMPLTRGGFFGLALGLATPVAMLLMHLIYGAALGGIYGLLLPKDAAEDRHGEADHASHAHSPAR